MTDKHNFQRIRWHSRRGLLELDLVLVPFADKYFGTLDDVDQDCYVKLLACEDQDLLPWILGQSLPDDPDLSHIVRLILAHKNQP
ncbi:MAG TPA: succinate dehydrogenase assembly factor 2 [Pseudomonadales bacterium]|nr:succinate dehydrogenase assembly factor 2 [Pseudomonadales bacterium]